MLGKHSRPLTSRLALLVGLLLLMAIPGMAAAQTSSFPDLIPLPTGFAPEGIASGRGTTFFTGSLSGQGIFQGDLRTGEGEILVDPGDRIHVGMKLDQRSNFLFVAGGPAGTAYVYDAGTGAELANLQLVTEGDAFINDVVVTRDAAYFTNSFQPFIYRVPLGPGGELQSPVTFEAIMLGCDWVQVAGAFNANGIDATPNGQYLIVVNSSRGELYRVDPATGCAQLIDLGGASVTAGDGILLHGHTLYVVRNMLNEIAVFEMSADFTSATLVDTITDDDFAVPTTIAQFGPYLYAVNAKFGTPAPGTDYEVVQLQR